MIRECLLPVIFATLLVTVSCNENSTSLVGKVSPKGSTTNRPDGKQEHFSVASDELIDRTVRENLYGNPGYEDGIGMPVLESANQSAGTSLRKLVSNFEVGSYSYHDRQNLYKTSDLTEILSPFSNKIQFTSSLLRVKESTGKSKVESWLKVSDPHGAEGWAFVGYRDPFENENWVVVGTVPVDGKDQILRKYDGSFDTARGQPAYDEPSLKGKIIWRAERTDQNSQINLDSIYVTDATFKGEYFTEHWVKVKDSYGRIGWFPGDVLDVQRGGPKYMSPENIVHMAFWEP